MQKEQKSEFVRSLKALFSNIGFLAEMEKRKLLCLSIILFLSLLYFYDFLIKPGLPNGADAIGAVMFNGVHYKNSDWFSSWWPYHALGHIEIPSGWCLFFYAFLMNITRNAFVTVRIVAFTSFVFGAFSMFFLAFRFCKRNYASLFAALFFSFNPWILGEYAAGHYGVGMGYSFFPLLFLAYDYALSKRNFKGVVFAASVTTLLTSVHQHLILFSGTMILLFIAAHFAANFKDKRIVRASFKIMLIIIFLTIGLSSGFLIPNALLWKYSPLFSFKWGSEGIRLYSCYDPLSAITIQIKNGYFQNYKIQNLLAYFFPISIDPTENYTLFDLTTSDLARYAFASIFPILAFSALLIKKDKNTYLFTVFAIVSIFLSMGTAWNNWLGWLGEIINVVYFTLHSLPILGTIRVPRRFLSVTCFSYSILIATSTSFIFQKIKTIRLSTSKMPKSSYEKETKFRDFALIFFILGATILNSWWGPFAEATPFHNFTLPPSYDNPYKWISAKAENNSGFRIATLPFNVPDYYPYKDPKFPEIDELQRTRDFGYYSVAITGVSAVYYYPDDMGALPQTRYFLKFIDQLIEKNNKDDFLNALKILGSTASIRYVVLQTYVNETNNEQYKLIYELTSNSILKEVDGYRPEDDELIIDNKKYWKPLIYATPSYAIIKEEAGSNALEAFKLSLDVSERFLANVPLIFDETIRKTMGVQHPLYSQALSHADGIFTYDNVTAFKNIFEQSEKKVNPICDYTKIDGTKYIIHIENATTPFFLVFTESYSPLWKLNVDGEIIEPIVTNYFSNGYYVTKHGEYYARLEFVGQNVVNLSWSISIATIIFIAVYIVLWPKRNALFIIKKLYLKLKL